MKKIIFSLIVLSFLIAGCKALAEESLPDPGALPDNTFYFLKLWKESIQTFFTFGAENKAKQFLHLAEIRLAEYQKMVEKKKIEIAQKTLDKYEKQLNNALAKTEELKNKNKDAKDMFAKIEEAVSKHLEILQNNLQKAPESARKGLENAVKNSQKILQKDSEAPKQENEEPKIIGGDKDAYGCLIAAGYSWCEIKNKCLKTWEEPCKEEETLNAMDKFAKCLTDKGVKLYGASWCPHCVNQKNLFGGSLKYMPYVECAIPNSQTQAPVCQNAGIRAYPTWIFPDGKQNLGEMTLEQLSQSSGCALN